MAQYNQIQAQSYTLEELQRYYPNICVDNAGNIIFNSDDQQFGQQQVILQHTDQQHAGILVSGDGGQQQLVVEGMVGGYRQQLYVIHREPPPPPPPPLAGNNTQQHDDYGQQQQQAVMQVGQQQTVMQVGQQQAVMQAGQQQTVMQAGQQQTVMQTGQQQAVMQTGQQAMQTGQPQAVMQAGQHQVYYASEVSGGVVRGVETALVLHSAPLIPTQSQLQQQSPQHTPCGGAASKAKAPKKQTYIRKPKQKMKEAPFNESPQCSAFQTAQQAAGQPGSVIQSPQQTPPPPPPQPPPQGLPPPPPPLPPSPQQHHVTPQNTQQMLQMQQHLQQLQQAQQHQIQQQQQLQQQNPQQLQQQQQIQQQHVVMHSAYIQQQQQQLQRQPQNLQQTHQARLLSQHLTQAISAAPGVAAMRAQLTRGSPRPVGLQRPSAPIRPIQHQQQQQMINQMRGTSVIHHRSRTPNSTMVCGPTVLRGTVNASPTRTVSPRPQRPMQSTQIVSGQILSSASGDTNSAAQRLANQQQLILRQNQLQQQQQNQLHQQQQQAQLQQQQIQQNQLQQQQIAANNQQRNQLSMQQQQTTRVITSQGQRIVQTVQTNIQPVQTNVTPVRQPTLAVKKITVTQQQNDLDDLEESITAAVLSKTQPQATSNQQFGKQQPMPQQHPRQGNQATAPGQVQQHFIQQQQFNNPNYQQPQGLLHQQQMFEVYCEQNTPQPQQQLTFEQQVVFDNQNKLPQQQINAQSSTDDDSIMLSMSNGKKISMADLKRLRTLSGNRLQSNRTVSRPGGNVEISGRQTITTRKDIPIQAVAPLMQQDQRQEVCADALANVQVLEQQSAKMLVVLPSGEQRLITFTLPKETCTLQEVLEQVGVTLTDDTSIQCLHNNNSDINYFVSIGSTIKPEDQIQIDASACVEPPSTPTSSGSAPDGSSPETPISQVTSTSQDGEKPSGLNPCQSPPREVPRDLPPPPPRLVEGMLALCKFCGYTGLDFNKCQRCKRVFPEEPKAIPIDLNKKPEKKLLEKSPIKEVTSSMPGEFKLNLLKPGQKPLNKGSPQDKKQKNRKARKQADQEPVILTLSSDEEDSNSSSHLRPVDSRVSTVGKEPTLSDMDDDSQPFSSDSDKLGMMASIIKKGQLRTIKSETLELNESTPSIRRMSPNIKERTFVRNEKKMQELSADLHCRTIRIGTYKYTPKKKVLISNEGIQIVAPSVKDDSKEVILQICQNDIVKVLVHFAKSFPVLFLYTRSSCGSRIRKYLDMTDPTGPYYNPTAKEDPFKRISLLPEVITDETKIVLEQLFSPNGCFGELSTTEANHILLHSCPRETESPTKMVTRSGSLLTAGKSTSSTESRQILIYPPGKGGITIYTADYVCLAQDQFLNDVIIDFYLQYLLYEVLTAEQREKTYIFSTFFYKRLTRKEPKCNRSSSISAESDLNLTPAQKRHARVRAWTKNVNLFQKDFIVVPINESSHWFLAIICYPHLEGCRSVIDNKVVSQREIKKKERRGLHIGNTTITPLVKQDPMTLSCDGEFEEEKDEAEAEDSDLDMDMEGSESEGDSDTQIKEQLPIKGCTNIPIKQPCILIFDSLAGTSRSRVVATLRDYLTWEYWAKTNTKKIFNKDNMKGVCPKVPQQNNFTDCGLYLLQYVENFFKVPIKDYSLPIKQLTNWFEELVVTKKREDISELLKNLMKKFNPEAQSLPEITFPTLNGILLDPKMEPLEGDEANDNGEASHAGQSDEPSSDGAADSFTCDKNSKASDEYLPKIASVMFRPVIHNEAVRKRYGDKVTIPLRPSELNKDAPITSLNKKFILGNDKSNSINQISLENPVRSVHNEGKQDVMSYLKARRMEILNEDSPEIKRLKKNES